MAELPQPWTEVEQMAAEEVNLGAPIAMLPLVLRQRDGDDEFPLRFTHYYDIRRRTGTVCSRIPA